MRASSRAHLVTYHGVLAPAAAMRRRIAPPAGRPVARRGGAGGGGRRYLWAELLKRVFAGGRVELRPVRRPPPITAGCVVRAMLTYLGLPTEPPRIHPARGPPAPEWG